MSLTGCGPSSSRLMFDGDERKYELWEVKFLGYLRLKKLSDTILTAVNPDAEDEVIRADAAKNADAFAELIQVLDDRSLSLYPGCCRRRTQGPSDFARTLSL